MHGEGEYFLPLPMPMSSMSPVPGKKLSPNLWKDTVITRSVV